MSLMTRLYHDERGSPATEFAIICPVLLMVLLGLGDLAFQGYIQDVLTGAVQKAGRDATIQYATLKLDAIDAMVEAPIKTISPNAKFVSSRKSYTNYTQIAPEPFTDANSNGKYDKGECFQDINGNGSWDADPGAAGQGGAGDVAVYTMQVTYPRLFPLGKLAGLGDEATVQATTILKNQPYANQTAAAIQTICK